MPPRRVLVVTTDPLTEAMPGPAIRAWHLAEALSTTHDVVLVSTVASDRTHTHMSVGYVEAGPDREELEAWAEVAVIPAGVFHEWPGLARPELVLVVDAYDPYHLENLEPGETSDIVERDEQVGRLTAAISAHLARADLVLCASSRQRDFWLGTLAAIGRVNPYTYDQDPTLRSLVTLVPFGMPSKPPVRQGRGLRETLGVVGSDKVILWGGGVYNWFDPLTLVKAVDRLSRRVSGLRLVFMGMAHPNPAIPPMPVAHEVARLAGGLGLTGTTVLFNQGWVPYEERASWLLDADVGVSTHLDHVEAHFSNRTRVLDYIWAGLPMVVTEGDVLSEALVDQGIARAVPPGDVEALELGLEEMLDLTVPEGRFTWLRERYSWEQVAEPLVEFCDNPRRAPDLIARPEPVPPPRVPILPSIRHEVLSALRGRRQGQ